MILKASIRGCEIQTPKTNRLGYIVIICFPEKFNKRIAQILNSQEAKNKLRLPPLPLQSHQIGSPYASVLLEVHRMGQNMGALSYLHP